MKFTLSANSDLVWNFHSARYFETAVGFLKRFENSLCMFSSSVRQLYTNYEIIQPTKAQKRMVALPNPFAYHDTYNNVIGDAIEPTGMHVVPLEYLDKSAPKRNRHELLLMYRSKKTGRYKAIPLKKGLQKLQQRYGAENFLPVMINKDLKFIDGKVPSMHLHRINLKRLNELSSFERTDIQGAIQKKLISFIA